MSWDKQLRAPSTSLVIPEGTYRLSNKPQKLLHIARNSAFMEDSENEALRLYHSRSFSPLADLRFDVQNIPIEDNTYDTILCNHVLEHVDDDRKAIREFQRILKPGGMAIMQVPLDPDYKVTDEDPTIKDPAERERRFRQYDHVRFTVKIILCG